MRKPTDVIQINLRLRESLRRKLERSAAKHRSTLSNEIRIRLEDSFEDRSVKRDFTDLALDIENAWARFSARFLRLDLEEQLATKLAECKELPVEIAILARQWLQRRAHERLPSSLVGGAS
jgi:hypothetical protein